MAQNFENLYKHYPSWNIFMIFMEEKKIQIDETIYEIWFFANLMSIFLLGHLQNGDKNHMKGMKFRKFFSL